MNKNIKGFTLIELLVVIAIFALMANITMVSLNNAKRESRDTKRMSDINQLRSALQLYSMEKLSYPDGDGYNDDIELRYGYDPLIAGDTKLQAILYYRPKLSASLETTKGNELKSLVRKKLGAIKISDKNWQTLVRAYIYGHYPIDAIVKAIRIGGVTVHPTIPWETWKNTAGYKKAMGI